MRFGKRTGIAAGAAVLLGTVAIAGRGEPANRPGTTAPQAVVVERQDLTLRAEAAGTVEPILVVEVKSKASGEVLALRVETGDVVPQGAALAEIDPRDVQNSLDQAAADLESARVQLSTAEANRERMEELRQSQSVTQQEYESAVQSAAAARAGLVRAQTNLQLARERRGDVSIDAPIAGTVIERTVEVGQIIASATSNVSGGTTLLKMADLSQMQVRALVDETDIGRVRAGQPAEVTVEAYPERVFRGEVLKIEPQAVVEQNVTMFAVLVRLDNEEGLLMPGMNAEIGVEIARRAGVVTVPNDAVVSPRDAAGVASSLGAELSIPRTSGQPARDGGSARPGIVFVQGPSGPEARRVLLGLSDWERTEILEGLEPGESVLLAAGARMEAQQEAASRAGFGGRSRRGR